MKVTESGFIEGSAPATPPTGIVKIYAKTDGLLYSKDDAGVETGLSGGGGGGVVSVASADSNITVVDGTSNAVLTLVQAPALKSATTTINVSSATAPSSGQVLTATSATSATWQSPSGALTGPAFSAYPSSNQSLTSGPQKVLFQTEEFDTNNNFASSTFTPTVAGYYFIGGGISIQAANISLILSLYKNGSFYKNIGVSEMPSLGQVFGFGMVFLNGSTDYVELFASPNDSIDTNAVDTDTYFQGFLARAN
jgi:hypothetical protein